MNKMEKSTGNREIMYSMIKNCFEEQFGKFKDDLLTLLTENFMEMQKDIAKIEARVEERATTGKRAIRGERNAAPKAVGAAAAEDSSKKVKNKMLYFRKEYKENNEFRAKYYDGFKHLIPHDEQAKINKETGEKRINVESQKLWRVLPEPEKEIIKDQFLRWSAANLKIEALPLLDTEKQSNSDAEEEDF